MCISIEQVKNRKTLFAILQTRIHIRDIYPDFSLFLKNSGVNAIHFTNNDFIILLCVADRYYDDTQDEKANIFHVVFLNNGIRNSADKCISIFMEIAFSCLGSYPIRKAYRVDV